MENENKFFASVAREGKSKFLRKLDSHLHGNDKVIKLKNFIIKSIL